MICPKCNFTVDDNANFCQNCGYKFEENKPRVEYVASTGDELKVGVNSNEHISDEVQRIVDINNQRVAKMNKNKNVFLGIVAGCAAALLILVIISFFI